MKTAMWIVGALAAFLATNVDADGICYDPNRGVGSSVAGDMGMIKSKGFSHVRTYISDGIAETVAGSGLRSMLGIPYENGQGSLEPHVQAALNAVKTGTVDYIMVGNENLAGMGSVPGDFIDYIRSIKQRFPGVRVGTVQRSTELMNNIGGLAELVAACDVIGVNIHPFFTNLGNVRKSAISETEAQWTSCKARVNGYGKPLILTETGWPTSGGMAGNGGSTDSAQAYWNTYKSSGLYGSLADSDKYYFQFFDTPNKGPEYEKTYGLFSATGGAKGVNAGGVPAPTPTPAPTTSAPITPAPTTPAPTTQEPTVASNSTSGSADLDELPAGSGSDDDVVEVGGEASNEIDLGIANNEEGVIDLTPSPEDAGTTKTGDNKKDDTTEANTQSTAGGSTAGVVVIIIFGVAAVGAAFGFIYKARMKAAEIERSESKSFDMTVTPGGACVL